MLNTTVNKTKWKWFILNRNAFSYAPTTNFFSLTFSNKMLAPHVRVWDSVSLNTLHVIGSGVFDRAVTCVAFSKSVC